jgi:hypothetical protein
MHTRIEQNGKKVQKATLALQQEKLNEIEELAVIQKINNYKNFS